MSFSVNTYPQHISDEARVVSPGHRGIYRVAYNQYNHNQAPDSDYHIIAASDSD